MPTSPLTHVTAIVHPTGARFAAPFDKVTFHEPDRDDKKGWVVLNVMGMFMHMCKVDDVQFMNARDALRFIAHMDED